MRWNYLEFPDSSWMTRGKNVFYKEIRTISFGIVIVFAGLTHTALVRMIDKEIRAAPIENILN